MYYVHVRWYLSVVPPKDKSDISVHYPPRIGNRVLIRLKLTYRSKLRFTKQTTYPVSKTWTSPRNRLDQIEPFQMTVKKTRKKLCWLTDIVSNAALLETTVFQFCVQTLNTCSVKKKTDVPQFNSFETLLHAKESLFLLTRTCNSVQNARWAEVYTDPLIRERSITGGEVCGFPIRTFVLHNNKLWSETHEVKSLDDGPFFCIIYYHGHLPS